MYKFFSYSVCLNGERGKKFKPTRGLRQGDPFSPYMFLIYGEWLSPLMRMTRKERKIKEVKVNRWGSEITHLLFVDGCILFGEVTTWGVNELKDILKNYEFMSGQKVNLDKSALLFSSNSPRQDRDLISWTLQVRCLEEPKSI